MRKSDLDCYINDLGITPYARVLGFRKESTDLLSELDKNTSIPLITKLADASQILPAPAYEMLKKDNLNKQNQLKQLKLVFLK